MALLFFCEDGLNPVPPGVLVTLSDASGNVLAEEYTFADGSIGTDVQGAVPYSATFVSSQLTAGLTVSFFGNALPNADTIVPVPGATPTLFSQAGSASFLLGQLPKGWSDPSDPGDAMLAGTMGGALATMDASIARLISSIRGQTCQGPDLDSWAFQLFGNYVRRYSGESDANFYSRCVALMGPRRTLAAIQAAVIAWYAATLPERIAAASPELAFDESGQIDKSGGFDLVVPSLSAAQLTPSVSVWDAMSEPALAATYSIAPPYFVIQIGFTGAALAWYLDRSYLGINTFLLDEYTVSQSLTPPDPRLGEYVSLVKAASRRAVYLVTSTL
jgi:hypothetical protein